ncbi:MAG: M55 family metallopeptidase [Chloroflexi bacterium]|nr:M55 family metallopeptidase [Chloroflexota bacterium]
MMQVYVVVDMEGISGVVNIQQVDITDPAFAEGREMLAGDVNAAVAGAFDAGAERVVVSDFHDSRRNFLIADLDERAEYEVPHGRIMPGLTSAFHAVIVVGMHAKSGTARAFLEHTVEPTWHRYSIEGVEHGELALIVFSAGALDIPVVFVSGDRAAVEEAQELLPSVETIAVKEGLARLWCRTLAPGRAHTLIRSGVARALSRQEQAAPTRLTFPVSVQLEFNRCSDADVLDGRPGFNRRDGFTVEWTARTPEDLVPF